MSDYLDSFYTNPAPLTAAGIGIPNGPGANNYFWMVQPRALFGKGAGQWIEMGADIEAMLELPDGSFLRVYGKAVGSNGTPDVVRVLVRGYGDKGVPDAMYGIDAKNARKVEGLLPEGYAEGKGAKPATPAGRIVSDGRKPQKLADIESAPITPDDERMAEQGSNAPEAKGGKDYEASPEGQRAIANLPEDAADVATPDEVADMIDGESLAKKPTNLQEPQRTLGGSRSGDVDIMNGDQPVGQMRKDMLQSELNELMNKTRTPKEESRLGRVLGELRYRDREADILSSDDRAAYGYGFTDEPEVSSDGKITTWKKEDSSGEFTRTISRETMPDGSTRWFAQDYRYDARDNATVEFGAGRGYYENSMKAFETEGHNFDLDLAEEWEGLQEDSERDARFGKSDMVEHNMKNGSVFFVDPGESVSSVEDIYEKSSGDVSQRGDGKFEGTNYVTGKIESFDNKEDAVAWLHNEFNNVNYEKENADREANDAARSAAEKAELEASAVPMLSRDEFQQRMSERVQADEEMGTRWDKAAVLPPKEEIDAAYESYKASYDGLARDNGVVDEDNNYEAISEILDEYLYPNDGIMDDIVSRAMNGEDPGTVDDVIRSFNPPRDDDEDDEDPFSKDEPSDEDLMDIEAEGDLFDSTEDLAGMEISKVKQTDLYNVEIGDIIKVNGGPARITDIEETDDGGIRVSYVDDGGFEGKRKYDADERVPVATLSPRGKSSSDTPEPESITPEDSTPVPTSPAELPDLPDNAEMVPGNQLERGDTLFSDRGFEKGTIVDIQKDRAGNVEVRLQTKNGMITGWTKTDRRGNSVVKGEKAPEPVVEPEAPNDVDADTAKASGFFEGGAEWLRGMKAKPGGDGPIRKSFGRALQNGRTSQVAQDVDGSWFLQKHDEFNGGIKETKRFETLQEALDEGNAFLENRDPKFDVPETNNPEIIETPAGESAPDAPNPPSGPKTAPAGGGEEPPKPPKGPKTKKPSKKKPDPEEKQASGDEPTTPNDDASIFSVEGREDHGDDIGRDPDFNNAAARNRKIPFATDKDGNVLYTINKKGKRVPVQDRNAILKAVLEDNKNAVVDKDGNIVFYRRTYVGSDGKNMTYEVLVHKNTGGKTGISVRFTNQDTGEVQTLIHHDERDSYTGLLGETNGPERLIDILEGTDANGEQVERKTATRGFSTEGLTDPHQRVEYFREQGRLLTLEETANKYMDGQAEIINTSLGAGGKAYGTKRQSEIMSLEEAIRTGNRAVIDERLRAMAGHFPLNQESIKALRAAIRSYLRRGGMVSEKDLGLFVDAFSAHLTRGIKNPLANDIPYKSSDTRPVKVGMYVEWKNNVGEVSRGRVVGLMERAYSANDSEYLDNAIVEFADGRQVNYLTTKNMTISTDQKDETKSPFKPWVRGIELRKQRNMVQFRDDLRARAAAQAESSVKGGKVDDLEPGNLFYGKDGNLLGHVVDIQPIEGAGGKRGFAILIVDAEGNDRIVNVAAGEIRGPKA
jgi:hypothetical protein